MLTHHCIPVCLSLISTDLPIWSVVETAATLYQKDTERFHLLIAEPPTQNQQSPEDSNPAPAAKPRLLWLNISPYRVTMTMQGNGQVNYRHYWEQGVYGLSRYWLRNQSLESSKQMCFRNFTRSLKLTGRTLPEHLRLEYELWSEKIQLGSYVLTLDLQH